MVQKLQRTLIRSEAHKLLRDWIIEGKLLPGQKLRDKELADQLGVSRTPIREALLRLEQEGLVQSKANSITTVSPINLQEAHNLYSIISSLETLALNQAFEFLKKDQIKLMVDANESMYQSLKSKDTNNAVLHDNAFHAAFINISRNQELCRISEELKYKLRRLELHYFGNIHSAYHSYDEHLEIIRALKKKDLPRAQAALEANWQNSLTRII